MNYFKKNVNFVLLYLIVLSIAAFAGFTVYYEGSYNSLAENFTTKVSEVEDLASELNLRKSQLNQTLTEFEIKVEREEDLSTKYTGLRDVNEELRGDLASTELKLSNTKFTLADTEKELDNKKIIIEQLNIDLNKKDDEIDDLEDKINCLEAKIDDEEGDC